MSSVFKRMVLIPEKEYLQLKEKQKTGNMQMSPHQDNITQLNNRLNRGYQSQSDRMEENTENDTEQKVVETNQSTDNLSPVRDSPVRMNSTRLDQSENQSIDQSLSEKDNMSNDIKPDLSVISSSPDIQPSTSASRPTSEAKRSGLIAMIKKISHYFSEKDLEKAKVLMNRIVLCRGTRIDMEKRKIVLGTFSTPFADFADVIQLCLSRKKPTDPDKLKKYYVFLSKNNFPLHLITNSYMKKSIQNIDISNQSPNISALNRSGSHAMEPKTKPWFQSINDVI